MGLCSIPPKHGIGGECFFRLPNLDQRPHQVLYITGFFPELHKAPENRESPPVILMGDEIPCITP